MTIKTSSFCSLRLLEDLRSPMCSRSNSPLGIIGDEEYFQNTQSNNFHLLDIARFPPRKLVLSATSAADKIRTINRRSPSFCPACGLSFLCANCSARARWSEFWHADRSLVIYKLFVIARGPECPAMAPISPVARIAE